MACVRYLLLMLPLAALAAAEPAAVDTTGSGDELFGFGRSIVTLIGLGGALILLAILFMLRKFLGFVMNAVFMTLGAVLVVVALFGHDLGVYAAIDQIVRSGGGP